MDFEFITDVTGQPLAKCETEAEAFGDWLSHDIGANKSAIASLLETVESALSQSQVDFEFSGKIYHLIMSNDEVELFLNNNQISHSEFANEQSDEAVAGCGLVEFKHLLENWLDFVVTG